MTPLPPEQEAALCQLPDAYALALRLVAADTSEDEMCQKLGVERECLAPMLDLARRKLERILTQG